MCASNCVVYIVPFTIIVLYMHLRKKKKYEYKFEMGRECLASIGKSSSSAVGSVIWGKEGYLKDLKLTTLLDLA